MRLPGSDLGTRIGCKSRGKSWARGAADLLNDRQLTDGQQVRIGYSLNNSETTFYNCQPTHSSFKIRQNIRTHNFPTRICLLIKFDKNS